MRLSFGHAIASMMETLRSFRWVEYAPFFWIFAAEAVFLAICSQLRSGWAMGLVAPLAKLAHGEQNLHYPVFFAYVSILMGWIESFLYAVPGAVLIPLSVLRVASKRDRALASDGMAPRVVAAFFPTLAAGLIIVGASWSWQMYLARRVLDLFRGYLPAPFGDYLGWFAVILASYAIITLLLYVPVAAVRARTSPARAFATGVRFGLRSWLVTLCYAVLLGIPAMVVQFVLERQGALLITRLRPELILIGLGIYAFFTSLSTYWTYATAARVYSNARGEE